MTQYERHTYEIQSFGDVIVYGWGTYERSSVLAGQAKKVFIDSYDSLELAHKDYPDAQGGGKFTDPQISLDHLPSEDDPVAGGMYPDDINDGY